MSYMFAPEFIVMSAETEKVLSSAWLPEQTSQHQFSPCCCCVCCAALLLAVLLFDALDLS